MHLTDVRHTMTGAKLGILGGRPVSSVAPLGGMLPSCDGMAMQAQEVGATAMRRGAVARPRQCLFSSLPAPRNFS